MTCADMNRTTPPHEPAIEPRADGRRMLVTVSGNLTLGSCRHLQLALNGALRSSAARVEIDLAGVDRCDCSTLNILLKARRDAHLRHKSITVVATGPAIERMLTITGTRTLFCPPQAAEGRGSDLPPSGTSAEPVDESLRIEVVQLRRAMETRPDIDLARGILMASFGLSADEAWEVLVEASQKTNTKLHRLARDVVTTVGGVPLAKSLQRQLTSAAVGRRAVRPSRMQSGRAARPPCRTGVPSEPLV
jgi:anti-anti-sigma factor